MANAVILHDMASAEGVCDPSLPELDDSSWISRVKEEIGSDDYHVAVPNLPNPHTPDYDAWEQELERNKIDCETTLIGDGAGGGFLLKLLSVDRTVTPGKLILVRPWMDPSRRFGYEFMCHWRADRLGKIGSITVFYSEQDDQERHASLNMLREHILPSNAEYNDITGDESFLLEDNFRELVNAVVGASKQAEVVHER